MVGGLTIWIMHLPAAGVYTFIFAWLFVESTGFPISDEPLLLLAGYLSQRHRLDLPLAISVALVGKVLASSLAYAVGRYVDLLWLARPDGPVPPGQWSWLLALRPTRATLLGAEARFRRQGVWAVFLGRLVPVVRSFINYPAGAARMPFGIFLAATSAGSLLWITTWTLLGEALGRSYEAAAARWGTLSCWCSQRSPSPSGSSGCGATAARAAMRLAYLQCRASDKCPHYGPLPLGDSLAGDDHTLSGDIRLSGVKGCTSIKVLLK
ncbi:MAG TPA: DedA family protein [Ktedonobacterales bacterium]